MDYKQEYEVEKVEWIDKEVARYEEETGIKLDAHNRSTLRRLKGSEFDFWEREAVRVDNNNSHDDQ